MKARFGYTCTCGTNDVLLIDENSIKEGQMMTGDCTGCTNTIVIIVNGLNREKKVANYTVQIRETVRD